jgi:hypothetical protein
MEILQFILHAALIKQLCVHKIRMWTISVKFLTVMTDKLCNYPKKDEEWYFQIYDARIGRRTLFSNFIILKGHKIVKSPIFFLTYLFLLC